MSATETTANSELAELITRACGPRSLSEYSRECGISAAHLSRVKSGICKPTKKLCLKMASEAYTKQLGLSSDEFLRAAGYSDDEVESTKEYENVAKQHNETIALGIVSQRLMRKGYTYQLLPMGENREVDFAFLVSKENTNIRWEFVVSFSCGNSDGNISMNAYYYNLGRLMSFVPAEEVQYTLLLNDVALYEKMVQSVNPEIVSANVSIALVDNNSMAIKRETIMGRGSEEELSLIVF